MTIWTGMRNHGIPETGRDAQGSESLFVTMVYSKQEIGGDTQDAESLLIFLVGRRWMMWSWKTS